MYGASVSKTIFSNGTSLTTSTIVLAFLNVTNPPIPIFIPILMTCLAISKSPEKQCTIPFGLYFNNKSSVSL